MQVSLARRARTSINGPDCTKTARLLRGIPTSAITRMTGRGRLILRGHSGCGYCFGVPSETGLLVALKREMRSATTVLWGRWCGHCGRGGRAGRSPAVRSA